MAGVSVLRGVPPTGDGDGSGDGSGSGDGYGYGSGDGSGSGSGYGDGYGYGSGDGDGSGSGSGYGDGYGSGDGSGSGSGYGDGYGYGYGSGDGDGYGDGYGYGYGSGDGYGDGYGYGEYWTAALPYFTDGWSDAQLARLETVRATTRIALWRSNAKGLPANGGGRIEVAAAGVVHRASGPLNLCEEGTLHATLIPPKWQGERIWIVAMHGEVIGDDEKFGCLEREILGEARLGDKERG